MTPGRQNGAKNNVWAKSDFGTTEHGVGIGRTLEQLRNKAERIMLMRARAFVLLQWRGYCLTDSG